MNSPNMTKKKYGRDERDVECFLSHACLSARYSMTTLHFRCFYIQHTFTASVYPLTCSLTEGRDGTGATGISPCGWCASPGPSRPICFCLFPCALSPSPWFFLLPIAMYFQLPSPKTVGDTYHSFIFNPKLVGGDTLTDPTFLSGARHDRFLTTKGPHERMKPRGWVRDTRFLCRLSGVLRAPVYTHNVSRTVGHIDESCAVGIARTHT